MKTILLIAMVCVFSPASKAHGATVLNQNTVYETYISSGNFANNDTQPVCLSHLLLNESLLPNKNISTMAFMLKIKAGKIKFSI